MWKSLRFDRSPIRWLRLGALAIIATVALVTLTEAPPMLEAYAPGWVVAGFSAYALVFLRNTAVFPGGAPWQMRWWWVQLALSLPFEVTNLTVVTVASIPLVLPKRAWRRWLWLTLGAVWVVFCGRVGVNLWMNWDKLPASTTWRDYSVVPAGLLEIAAWHLFAYLAAVLIVQFDEDRRRLALLNAELRASQVLLMESGRLAERLRISRELHDSLGHHLTSLSLQLEVAEHLPDDQLRPPLKQARFIAKLVLAEIREAVSEWRAETSTALPDALRELAGALGGTQLVLDLGDEVPATSPTQTHALFRCAQEAVTNAMRHGAPQTITIRLRPEPAGLRLTIEDDGLGTGEVRPGNGLAGLRARIEEIGGSVEFVSSLGEGFLLTARVPLG